MVQALSDIQQIPSVGVFSPNALGNSLEFPVCKYRIPAGIGDSLGDRSCPSPSNNVVQFCLQNL